MRKNFRKNIRLVSTIAVCLLFVVVSFSNAAVKSEELRGTQTKNEQQTTIPTTAPLGKLLAAFKFLNWNFWDNPPHIFSRNLGNVGIGTMNPSAKLDVAGDFAINGEVIINKTGNWARPLEVNGDVKTSGVFKYVSPKIYYLNIPTAAFTCYSEVYYNYFNQGIYLMQYSGPLTYLTCPVNLPQGAIVKEFRTYAWDIDTTYNIELHSYLFTNDITGGYAHEKEMARNVLLTSGASNIIQYATDDTINNATIENRNNQYCILVSFDANNYADDTERFYGCRIAYTMDTIAP